MLVISVLCLSRNFLELRLRVPQGSHGLSADPRPDWKVDDLIAELDAVETKLRRVVLLKSSTPLERPTATCNLKNTTGFVMCLSDDEYGENGESLSKKPMGGICFSCNGLDFDSSSGETEDESDLGTDDTCLMRKSGVAEGLLFELERERQLRVQEEIREKVRALQAEWRKEIERSSSDLLLVEKDIEAKRETEKKLDKHYLRKIAEARDLYLSAVQRDHEQRSQIEERRIREEAAIGEAKRKEKLREEERLEKAKAEAQARLESARAFEAAQKAAVEVARKVAAEVAERQAAEIMRKSEEAALEKVNVVETSEKLTRVDNSLKLQSTGIITKVSETAAKLEADRIGKSEDLEQQNRSLKTSSNNEFKSFEQKIYLRVRQITGSQLNISSKLHDLVEIIQDPACPQSISISAFAKMVVAQCDSPTLNMNHDAFGLGYLIVLVTSQVPVSMDLVLAEFHKACIYTIPKHIQFSKFAFNSEEEYYKMIGYRDEDGHIESTESYLDRTVAYIRLYAALVQTDVMNYRNLHGLKEGWAWLARFLNHLPPNKHTAVVLDAFLKVAGFALYRRYKRQFIKVLNVISRKFLPSLKAQKGQNLEKAIFNLEEYIESKKYLEEPEGWRLVQTTESKILLD
ncbi:protein GLE1 isoform X1 [Amborella trichopoda]|uniref:protein GLE1 isoform X1 n=1 Tax=Amborella trichopoda TaxID=13333 RepID=UPI0009C13BF9|nr:protein GLE1 isoform X1 [Amborella trichopoda]|eukprot:XP_020527731.1 protein GLE1 isoform X1 [Amborella trichopoda]